MELFNSFLTLLVTTALCLHPIIARLQPNHSAFYLDPVALDGADTAFAAPPKDTPRPPVTTPEIPAPPPASDDLWENCRCKGENFLKAMHISDQEAGKLFTPSRDTAASEFTTTDDLKNWGWMDGRVEGPGLDFKNWGVDDVLRDLGSSGTSRQQGGTILVVACDHGDLDLDYEETLPLEVQTYRNHKGLYHPTGARYVFGMNLGRIGILIAMDRESPRYAGKNLEPKVEGSDLPSLQSFSDVAWVYWRSLLKDPTTIRYFLSVVISNEETLGIIGRALRNTNSLTMTPWPGKEFSADSDNGKALLGSPNAVAFSYFLIQHKATLGNLQVTKIRVFHGNQGNDALSMVFYVEPASSENEEEEEENTANILNDSVDGKNFMRRHLLKSRL